MKTHGFLIAMGWVASIATLPAQEISRESSNRYVGSSTYEFHSQEPGQLTMEDIRGDIVLLGEPSDRIEIVEVITIRTKSEEKAKEIFAEAKASVQQTSDEEEFLNIRVKGGRSRKREVSYDYTVKLPTVFSALVQTRGGDLDIKHLKGQIESVTSGGDISLMDLTGKISATTSGGDIDAIDLRGRVQVKTSGGDLDLEEIMGELFANTAGGDIDVTEVEGSVSVSTSGGDINLSDIEGREVTAETSGGDISASRLTSTIDLSTSGGNVELEEIEGDVEASTSGGDIDMNEIRGNAIVWTSGGSITAEEILGSLDGRTSAGDIFVSKKWDQEIETHAIDLKTSAGDIELILPRDFPATFSVQAMFPGVKSGEAIVSDFPLDITASITSARARGTTGDGKHAVNLESTGGTIRISWED